MSTNKLTNLRGRETLKDHNRPTNNKDGQDKCYVYKNHITKIRIISDMTIDSLTNNVSPLYIIRAGWSSLLRESVEESTLQTVPHCQPDISLTLSIQRYKIYLM